jgi:hypothetical protein
MKNSLIIVCAFNFFISCQQKNGEHDFVVTKLIRVDEGYQRSSEKKIKLGDDYYSPLASFKYEKDTLIEMIVYKSEGVLNYGREELESDSLILKYFKVPSLRKIDLSDNRLIDNGTSLSVVKNVSGDTIFCTRADTLYRYVFKKK